MQKLGIDAISFFTSDLFLDLATLAKQRELDHDTYYKSIGQYKMAIPAADEDIISMAANAALNIVNETNRDSISNVLFATESGVDQSKSAGIYLHGLLQLSPNCRVTELKQACYSSTAALQYGLGLIARYPEQKVLVVAADVARYGLNTTGEPSQGCGAVAILLSANPRFLEVEPECGYYTQDIMDFWRPNYREEAFVEGKYSSKMYLQCLEASWKHFHAQTQRPFYAYDYFCYHTPVCRLAESAHKHLLKLNQVTADPALLEQQIQPGLAYNRLTGNTYTAAVYMSLISLAENSKQDLTGKRVGIYAYGSGCVAEYFSGKFAQHYASQSPKAIHQGMLNHRREIDYAEYQARYSTKLPTDGSEYLTPKEQKGKVRFAGLREHKRLYERSS